MANQFSAINITVLGTASAQPSSTRSQSALALRLSGDVWLFDCGEGTQQQIQRSSVKMRKIDKIFVTHTHGDHIFGLLPLLASRLDGNGGLVDGTDDPRLQSSVQEDVSPLEIYGPLGTRSFIRAGLAYSHTYPAMPYVVHELRTPSDPPKYDHTTLPPRPTEMQGRNIRQTDGIWRDIFRSNLVSVSAAPIWHSVPCIGYVVTEHPLPGKIDPKQYVPHLKRTNTPMSVLRTLQQGENVVLSDGTVLQGPPRRPGRKLVILGDTCDPSPIAELADGADLLVHEATNAYLPGIDRNAKADDTYERVMSKATSRGHSTPQMAGAFAKRIRAKKLLLNHFSSRYAGNDDVDEEAKKVMGAIRTLALQEYDGDVVCARDFMSFDVELPH